MNIVITHQKGGVAKSTTALIIAAVLSEVGKTFEVVDLDPQKSLTSWLNMANLESTPGGKYKITDTPPSVLDKATILALKDADIVVVPSGTSVAELQVTSSTLPLFKERTSGEIKVLWSKVQANTQAGKALESFAEQLQVSSFNSFIGLRQCYQQDFITKGWGGLNSKAKEEVSAFVLELLA
jgi:cellulose biosynthesis protein BcsQ